MPEVAGGEERGIKNRDGARPASPANVKVNMSDPMMLIFPRPEVTGDKHSLAGDDAGDPLIDFRFPSCCDLRIFILKLLLETLIEVCREFTRLFFALNIIDSALNQRRTAMGSEPFRAILKVALRPLARAAEHSGCFFQRAAPRRHRRHAVEPLEHPSDQRRHHQNAHPARTGRLRRTPVRRHTGRTHRKRPDGHRRRSPAQTPSSILCPEGPVTAS